MVLSTIAGLVGIDMLAEELKEPVKKAFGWVFSKGKDKYDEHKLNQSIDDLSEKITKVTKVKTIYKGDDSIDLHEFYVPTKIDNRITNINCINDISKHRAIVLEGTVGQGKSIFMRFLTYQEAKQGQHIPLFFELRRLEEKQTLTNALSRQISNWITEFKESDFDTVAKTGKLVLFLDGFDEVPHNRVKSLLNEIEGWCERYPNMQVVISSRPEADIQRSNYFKVFKLSEYHFFEQSLLIDKLVEETEANELLKQAIKDSDTEIQELLKTPLMVTLFVMNYRGNLEIPSNQYEFYKDLFSVLISRHDKTKPGYQRELKSNLSNKELQEVFEQFCFISLNKDKLVFSYTEAIEIIEKCLDKQGLQDDSDKVLADFSKVVCLLLKDGMEYTFVHKSIPEYFYACYMADKPENVREKFYTKCYEDSIFSGNLRNALKFLKNNDEYCYYKYFLKKIVDDIIEYYNLENKHTFVKNTYTVILSSFSFKQHIGFYFEGSLSVLCYDDFDNFLTTTKNLITSLLKYQQYSIGRSFGRILDNEKDKLELVSEKLEPDDIQVLDEHFKKNSMIFLNKQKEINNFIAMKDSVDLDFD